MSADSPARNPLDELSSAVRLADDYAGPSTQEHRALAAVQELVRAARAVDARYWNQDSLDDGHDGFVALAAALRPFGEPQP